LKLKICNTNLINTQRWAHVLRKGKQFHINGIWRQYYMKYEQYPMRMMSWAQFNVCTHWTI
jgi:hypothetical protein